MSERKRFTVHAVDGNGQHWVGSQWDTLQEAAREARKAFRGLWFHKVEDKAGLYTGPRVLVFDRLGRTDCGAAYTADHSNMEEA